MLPKQFLPIPLNPERWEDIPNYEGLYQMSNLFRFRSLDKIVKCNNATRLVKGKVLNTSKSGSYNKLVVWNNNKEKRIPVHVVVAKKYINNPFNKPQVNHINGKKNNYHPLNLEWVTPSENMKHAFKYGLNKVGKRSGSDNPNAKINQDKANVIRDLFNTSLYTKTMLGYMFNIDRSCITDILNNKSWVY